jgi:hypothetical protein
MPRSWTGGVGPLCAAEEATIAHLEDVPQQPGQEVGRPRFLAVPTVTYKVLFVLLMLSHHRRRVVYVNVTAHPTAEWTAQQVVESFPWDEAPQYLLHDRDRSYGTAFRQRVRNPGDHRSAERPVLTVAESVCGAAHRRTRRACLAHIMVLSEWHLKRILSRDFDDDHPWRTHLSLDRDCPEARPVRPPASVHAVSEVWGYLIMLNGRQRDRKRETPVCGKGL